MPIVSGPYFMKHLYTFLKCDESQLAISVHWIVLERIDMFQWTESSSLFLSFLESLKYLQMWYFGKQVSSETNLFLTLQPPKYSPHLFWISSFLWSHLKIVYQTVTSSQFHYSGMMQFENTFQYLEAIYCPICDLKVGIFARIFRRQLQPPDVSSSHNENRLILLSSIALVSLSKQSSIRWFFWALTHLSYPGIHGHEPQNRFWPEYDTHHKIDFLLNEFDNIDCLLVYESSFWWKVASELLLIWRLCFGISGYHKM